MIKSNDSAQQVGGKATPVIVILVRGQVSG